MPFYHPGTTRVSPERRILAALCLAGAVLLVPVPVHSADVQAEVQKVLGNPDYQRQMPEHPKSRPSGEAGSPGAPGGGVLPPTAVPVMGAGAVLGMTLFVVLIVAAVLLLGVWLLTVAVQRRRRASAKAGAVEESVEGAPRREPAFDEATRLAAEGRYAEAVHALLLAAIRHFAERSRVSIEPSRTSRELVRLLPLGPDAREAFADLVRRVELSLFGGAPVSREDYERSLSRFQALTRRPA